MAYRGPVNVTGAAFGALALLGGLTLAACAPTASLTTEPVQGPAQVQIAASPAEGEISPAELVEVTVTDGRLQSVSVSGPDGPILGSLSADRRTWVLEPGTLDFDGSYDLTATAVDVRGVTKTLTHSVTTLEPERIIEATLTMPAPGSTVGVGMPIRLAFDRKVGDRAAVERALTVSTTSPQPVVGAWAWLDGRTVEFRPQAYWPGNIDVRVDARLRGVQASPGVYGLADEQFEFEIGPSMVTRVDAQTHLADVFRDGELARQIPITTGKDGFTTRSGVKVVMTKERSRIMDAATTGIANGDPEYYRLNVEYALRVTNSGEFVHAAPWSVGSQGRANVSHGCIGMSTTNAGWLWEQSSVGDIVEVTGTDRPQDLGNGITVWNEEWPAWLERSATGPVSTQPMPVLTGG